MRSDDLDGVLVVSVEQAVAAPYCSSRLADAGARVIKVERPEGDFARHYDASVQGESAYFVWVNRGKESIRLDLKQDDDRAVLDAMIARADVFLDNLSPGAMARLGFGHEQLRDRDPRLITCSITGYGSEGPYRDLKAYDLLVQAETGLATITGNAAGPVRVGVSLCDIAAGMTAFQSILQALIGRAASGRGRHVEVSLFHALADWMNVPYLQHVYGGGHPERVGLHHPTLAPYGVYPCADGDLLFSVQNDREWHAFCHGVLAMPELEHDARFATAAARLEHRADLDRIVGAVTCRATRAELIARLEKARIAYGRLSTLAEAAAHPHNRYLAVATPSGPARLLAPGATHDGELLAADTVPALGAHDAALRAEFAPAT